jgi:hypothetical protein
MTAKIRDKEQKGIKYKIEYSLIFNSMPCGLIAFIVDIIFWCLQHFAGPFQIVISIIMTVLSPISMQQKALAE